MKKLEAYISVMPKEIKPIRLLAGRKADGRAVFEQVLVQELTDGRAELMRSPGLVLGLAGGDVIQVSHQDQGEFRLVRRGGNIAIHVYLGRAALEGRLSKRLEAIGGRLDGKTAALLVFTVPARSGFASIERVMKLVDSDPQASWAYGNVYDEHNQPLGWWE